MRPEILYSGNYAGSRNTALHRHDGAELVLVTAGRCSNVVPGGSLAADTGSIFVIPPELPHRQIDFGEVKTSFVVFEPPDAGTFDLAFRVIDSSHDPFIAVWIMPTCGALLCVMATAAPACTRSAITFAERFTAICCSGSVVPSAR